MLRNVLLLLVLGLDCVDQRSRVGGDVVDLLREVEGGPLTHHGQGFTVVGARGIDVVLKGADMSRPLGLAIPDDSHPLPAYDVPAHTLVAGCHLDGFPG